MKKIKVSPVPKRVFEDLGWDYFVSEEAKDYLTTEMMVISEAEGEALYTAANDVYDKLMHAAQFALDNNLLGTLGIPRNLHELVRLTWEDEKHLHLFSRFDFAGGLNGQPIKLLEINANTPTMMPETAIIQWAQLKANGIEETRQFNFFFESLVEQFEELRSLNPDKDATLLVSTLRDSEEDEANMSLLSKAAEEAGFEVEFKYIDEVIFSATEGIWAQGNQNIRTRYDFWLQLVPWEFIAEDEPDLTHLLTQIVKNVAAIERNYENSVGFVQKSPQFARNALRYSTRRTPLCEKNHARARGRKRGDFRRLGKIGRRTRRRLCALSRRLSNLCDVGGR
jgi:glutathionylspermidine synthase